MTDDPGQIGDVEGLVVLHAGAALRDVALGARARRVWPGMAVVVQKVVADLLGNLGS